MNMNTYSCYETHDYKMTYLLSSHVPWTMQRKLFLLCECDRSRFLNRNQTCKIIPDDEHIQLLGEVKDTLDF